MNISSFCHCWRARTQFGPLSATPMPGNIAGLHDYIGSKQTGMASNSSTWEMAFPMLNVCVCGMLTTNWDTSMCSRDWRGSWPSTHCLSTLRLLHTYRRDTGGPIETVPTWTWHKLLIFPAINTENYWQRTEHLCQPEVDENNLCSVIGCQITYAKTGDCYTASLEKVKII